MRATFLKITRLAIVLVAIGLAYIVGTHAQPTINESSAYLMTTDWKPTTNESSASLMTTDWSGYLVVATDETIDAMPLRKPNPKAVPQVEIGLRSDGVVVWRSASKTK